jgi:hypothetical protein
MCRLAIAAVVTAATLVVGALFLILGASQASSASPAGLSPLSMHQEAGVLQDRTI